MMFIGQTARALGLCLTLCAAGAVLGGCKGASSASPRPDRAGDNEPAITKIDRAAKLSRDAQRHALAGDDDAAIAKYREAIAEYPELPVAWNNLGQLLMERGDNLAAAEAFDAAAELSPTDALPLHNIGAIWEKLGWYDDALKWYDRALQRDESYQPSLRRFLLVQELRAKFDDSTSTRLKRAMLQEDDPWWISFFKRFHQRNLETDASGATSPRTS